jgi:hypothetical protein
MAGTDIEEDQLIGSFFLVTPSYVHGVAGVAQLEEVDAFDHTATIDIETRD